jgi:hypothetical protein
VISMLAQGEYLWAPGAWVERNGQEQILVHKSHVALVLSVRVNKDGKHRTTEVRCRAAPLMTAPVAPGPAIFDSGANVSKVCDVGTGL